MDHKVITRYCTAAVVGEDPKLRGGPERAAVVGVGATGSAGHHHDAVIAPVGVGRHRIV